MRTREWREREPVLSLLRTSYSCSTCTSNVIVRYVHRTFCVGFFRLFFPQDKEWLQEELKEATVREIEAEWRDRGLPGSFDTAVQRSRPRSRSPSPSRSLDGYEVNGGKEEGGYSGKKGKGWKPPTKGKKGRGKKGGGKKKK